MRGLDDLRRRALWFALVLNAAFLVVEVTGALVFGSLALLADAAHMVSDVGALSMALFAQRLVTLPPSDRHTYGLVRAEVISGLINAVLLFVATTWIAIEAVGRFGDDLTVDGLGVIAVALMGFVVNAVSAWGVGRVSGRNLNLRGAFWHLAGDALGSVGALAAGVAVAVADADWVDPAVSLGIAALLVVSAVALVREATRVLLESTPRHVHVEEVEAALVAADGVEAVHHTHIWSLGSESVALSTHVVLVGEPSLHDAQVVGASLKELLADRFGIAHSTIELECHDCVTGHLHRLA